MLRELGWKEDWSRFTVAGAVRPYAEGVSCRSRPSLPSPPVADLPHLRVQGIRQLSSPVNRQRETNLRAHASIKVWFGINKLSTN